MPRLEGWYITSDNSNPFQAPELRKLRLEGKIYDDEKGRFPDGAEVSTSSIQELNLKENYAMTRNTKYILGKPDQDYIRYLASRGKKLEDYIK